MESSLSSTISCDIVERGMNSIGQFRGPVFKTGSTRKTWVRFTIFIESTLKDAILLRLKFLEAQINQEMIEG